MNLPKARYLAITRVSSTTAPSSQLLAQPAQQVVVDPRGVGAEPLGVLERDLLGGGVVVAPGQRCTSSRSASVAPASTACGVRHERQTVHSLIWAIRMRTSSCNRQSSRLFHTARS